MQNGSSIDFNRVSFPNPSYSSFVPKSFDQEGFPQVIRKKKNKQLIETLMIYFI